MSNTSNYPHGFKGGVTIRGLPVLNVYGKNVLWVSSTEARTGRGTFTEPFATIDAAINSAVAGDIILVKPGHVETLVAAGAITMDVAGVSIVGLGTGNNRPVLTCTPAAVGTNNITWSAANCSFENIVCVAGLDAITNPFNISGAGAYLDIEWQDGSATIEAETVVLTTAAADKLNVNLKYLGFTAGNACVAPIKLVGCTDGRINVDFYGVASTAVVNFITTLSTNIDVRGYAYNSGTTDGSKLVVDTVGSSLWYAEIDDGAAGTKFSGGSGSALAADDLSAVGTTATAAATGAVTTTDPLMAYTKQLIVQNGIELDTDTLGALLAGTGGIATIPAAAVPANGVNVFELLRQLWANQCGTAANENGITTWPSAAVPANNVSLAEALRYVVEQQLPIRTAFAKADVTAVTAWSTGNSPVTVATVTGVVMCRVFGHVTAAITSTGGTGTLSLGISDNVALWIAATTADATNFATNDVWVGPTTTTKGNLFNNTSGWALVSNDTIKVTIATNSTTAGGMTIYVEWMPVSSGATVA